MPVTIITRHGDGVPTETLAIGELAVDTTGGTMHVGTAGGNIPVGGGGGGEGNIADGTVAGQTTAWNHTASQWQPSDAISIDSVTFDVTIPNDLAVTGAVTVTGLINSRDVGADGAVLDAHVADASIHTEAIAFGSAEVIASYPPATVVADRIYYVTS